MEYMISSKEDGYKIGLIAFFKSNFVCAFFCAFQLQAFILHCPAKVQYPFHCCKEHVKCQTRTELCGNVRDLCLGIINLVKICKVSDVCQCAQVTSLSFGWDVLGEEIMCLRVNGGQQQPLLQCFHMYILFREGSWCSPWWC